jgi:hypothetical protein
VKLLPVLLLATLGLGVSAQPFSCFPRMRDQPSIKPHERDLPEAPEHQVPWESPVAPPLSEAEATAMQNPVSPTGEAVSLGRIYYGYYCLMCHGEKGNGEGPVGASYVPLPTDLTSVDVLGQPDGELARAMVMGRGHEPVLETTVSLEKRWYILHYMQKLAVEEASAPR